MSIKLNKLPRCCGIVVLFLLPLFSWAEAPCKTAMDKEQWEQALKLCKVEYQEGNILRAFYLATIYENGNGNIRDDVVQSKKQAAKWFRTYLDKTQDKDGLASQVAMTYLGMYMAGGIIPGGMKQACNYFSKAANAGLDDAMYRLSLCYDMESSGFPQDRKKSIYWLKKAKKKGHGQAAARLLEMEKQSN